VQNNLNQYLAAEAYFRALSVSKAQGQTVESDRLLDAQRRLVQSEVQFFRSRAEYAVALKNIHYEKGTLLTYKDLRIAGGGSSVPMTPPDIPSEDPSLVTPPVPDASAQEILPELNPVPESSVSRHKSGSVQTASTAAPTPTRAANSATPAVVAKAPTSAGETATGGASGTQRQTPAANTPSGKTVLKTDSGKSGPQKNQEVAASPLPSAGRATLSSLSMESARAGRTTTYSPAQPQVTPNGAISPIRPDAPADPQVIPGAFSPLW
jgi:hypothetical protein